MMKKSLVLLLVMFPCTILTFHDSDWTAYFGNPISAAWVTGMCAIKWIWPNERARSQAPFCYHAGKACHVVGAATSILSSAFAIEDIANAAHVDVPHQYITKAGAAMTFGLAFMSAGDYLVFCAAQKAHDSRIRTETEESVRTSLLPKSWNVSAKIPPSQSEDIV